MAKYVRRTTIDAIKAALFIMKSKLKHYNICCVDSCLRKYHSMQIYLINAIRKQTIPWKNAFDCNISHLHIVFDKHLDVLCFNTLSLTPKDFHSDAALFLSCLECLKRSYLHMKNIDK